MPASSCTRRSCSSPPPPAGCPTSRRSTASGCRCSEGRRAAARRVLAGRGSRRLPAVHDLRRCRIQPATSTACGTRPTAACCSTARISCPMPPRTWDELLDDGEPRRARAADRRLSLQRRPLGSDGLRSPRRCSGRRAASSSTRRPADLRRGAEPRRAMLRLLGFLRDTIQRGASPRSVLGNNDYQQLTGAAIAGDVAMFLGGNWQLKDLQTGLLAGRVRKVGHRADSAGRRRHALDRHRRLGLGGLRAGSRSGSARRSSSSATSKRRRTPRASARRPAICRCAGASIATSRSSARTRGTARFGEMLVDGHARPTVPIYPAISQQLQLAIGSVVSGDEDAGAGARRGVAGRQRRVRAPAASTHVDGAPRRRSARVDADRARGRRSGRAVLALAAPASAAPRLWLLPGDRAGDGHPALSDARPAAAVVHRPRRVAADALPLHARRAIARCSPTHRSTAWSA